MSNNGGGQRSGEIGVDELWTVYKSFIRETGLARQHLDSFNRLVTEEIQKIIDSIREVRPQWRIYAGRRRYRRGRFEEHEIHLPDVKIVFGKARFKEPMAREVIESFDRRVTPFECRVRGITYSAPLMVEMTIVQDNMIEKTREVKIADFPVMVKSVLDPLSKYDEETVIEMGEDPGDPGGYFIINGSEKVIVAQEDLAVNRIIVNKSTAATARITHTAKAVSTVLGLRRQAIVDRMSDGTLEASLSRLRYRIPLVVLLRALGLEKDMEIMLAVSADPDVQREMLPSLEKGRALAPTKEEALKYLGNRIAPGQPLDVRIRRAEEFLDTQLLPHLGNRPEDRIKKAYFLAEMANRVLQLYLGKRGEDDKDFLGNKRLRLAGDLIAELFRESLEALANTMAQKLEEQLAERRQIRLDFLVRPTIISDRLKGAIATGNWGQDRTGISQQLDRTNWISLLSHLRRVISPLSRGQAHFEARDLHGSHWGRYCPFETPEGINCGLVKNLALSAYISVGVDESVVEEILVKDLGVVPLEKILEEAKQTGEPPEIMLKGTKVFINGRPLGYHPNGAELARKIRELRRSGKLEVERPWEVSVYHLREGEIDELYINTDSGRLMRPVVVVENGEPKLTREHVEKLSRGEITFWDLVKQGVVEMLDPEEEQNALIAELPWEVTKEHTHMELWVPAIVGVAAATIGYLEHNQSPRNTYQAAMAKQALGVYALNYRIRLDSHSYLLQYPQVPIVQTRMLDIMGYNERPAGQNMVVAIMSYTGYNIEDALIFNKGSIDMGLARAYFFRVYTGIENEYPGGERDRITLPKPDEVYDYRGAAAYAKLEADGIVAPETEVEGGEILIGRVSPPRFLGEGRVISMATVRRRDTSIPMRLGEKGVVDMVVISTTVERNKLVKVRVRNLRIPEIGDKFASRHGQKGVIGMIFPRYDMPYTEEGIEPDVILNPHAIPSRMTVGQLLEEIAGKLGAIKGRFVDATPFFKEDIDGLRIELLKEGYDPNAREVMYDGRTGQIIEAPITIGVAYYQRLYHMVADKIHARATGRVHLLTRQPTEGKARQGGLRFGEMERDCLVGHGASMLLRDRMLDNSDAYVMYVCNTCGNIAWFNRRKKVLECPIHGEEGDIRPVKVPYAFKLLLQEITSMMIKPELKVADKISVIRKVVGDYT
ncbi:DNA-directed RNA polymerase subunit B [Aeropyrum pernix]|uniref:DNA-directed RNA polymerase subunit beta n=1 Tax=Aeropyrum pernix TaxID=56636 RepID=A0A401H968_AERPX|nr:DNA-directed RNA polymerase subunit B [Aeropyrum pernix]GBF08892.1 DNA-directed RNA polymerase subunit B [Aeropyrum pernix]